MFLNSNHGRIVDLPLCPSISSASLPASANGPFRCAGRDRPGFGPGNCGRSSRAPRTGVLAKKIGPVDVSRAFDVQPPTCARLGWHAVVVATTIPASSRPGPVDGQTRRHARPGPSHSPTKEQEVLVPMPDVPTAWPIRADSTCTIAPTGTAAPNAIRDTMCKMELVPPTPVTTF